MAARGHVDVNERRLRPVYDALDSLNNKQAIQLADKILKKQKDLHCAKVLKGLALLRSGKPADCLSLLEDVAQLKPTDDSTLQAMTICYREMQKPEKIPALYEAAVNQCSSNEEFHTHHFMSYVRVGDHKKQQKAAMNLYKAFPKSPYYFWAVMSIMMQALTSEDEKLSMTMFLPLAERMVERFIKENKIDAEAEVRLYLMILEEMGKYEKGLEVLWGALGAKLVSYIDERDEKEAEYLMRLCRWQEANAVYKKLLLRRPDQWCYYKAYFDSAFSLMKEEWKPAEEQGDLPDFSVDLVEKFIASLVDDERAKDKFAAKGPFLAQLEIEKQLKERGYADTRQGCKPILELLMEYFERFGGKASCFYDLTPYSSLLSAAQQQEFIDSIKARLPETPQEDFKTRLNLLYRKLVIEQLSRHFGLHQKLSTEEKVAKVKEYMQCYMDGLTLGQDLKPTEFQHSDGFVQLAVHLLLDVNEDKGNEEMFWHILILLENATKASQSNHNLKLLLVRVYCLMGAFKPCYSLFNGMDIKHIELDLVGYSITRFVEALGQFESAASVYTSTMKFFFSNQKDTPEHIIAAYKYGSFEKIPQFVKVMKRLNRSLNFSSITYEQMLLDTLQKTSSLSDAQVFFKETNLLEKCPASKEWTNDLMDNRDLRVLQSFDPVERQLSKEQEVLSSEQEKLWIRLRCQTIRILAFAVSLVPLPVQDTPRGVAKSAAVPDGEAAPGISLGALIDDFEELVSEIESHPGTRIKLPFVGPPPSRLAGFLDGQNHKILLGTLKVCHLLHQLQESPKEVSLEETSCKVKDIVETVSETIKGCVGSCTCKLTIGDGDKQIFNGFNLERLVLLVETYSHMTLISSVCCRFLNKITGSTKSKKKKSTSSHSSELVASFKAYLNTLKCCGKDLHTALAEIQINELADNLLELNLVELDHETHSSVVSSIWEGLQTSYKQSVKEISGLLKSKVDFAASLRV